MNLGKSKVRKFYLIALINRKGGQNIEYLQPFTNKKEAIKRIKGFAAYTCHSNVKLLTFECTKEDQIIGGKQ